MATTTYDFGKFGISLGGNWVSGTTYERYTKVRHNNASWISKKTTNVEPSTSATQDWMLDVQDGATGPAPIKQTANYVLLASEWTGSAGAWEYDLSDDLETVLGTEYNSNLRVDAYFDEENASIGQIGMAGLSNIFGTGTQSIVAHCDAKPTMNIPVILTWYV